MLRFPALCLILLLAACGVNQPPAPEPPSAALPAVVEMVENISDGSVCTEPRPQVCTMEYHPVCALREGGSLETMSSPCNACADVQVISHTPGVCENGE